jgi:glyoxylase-like metal-dependent hydrolase (beta-lactamase superfamily II)
MTAENVLKEADWLVPRFANEQGRLRLSFHSLIVESGSLRILIDTCVGDDKQRNFPRWNLRHSSYLSDLEKAGYPREAIDRVVCTHLHIDHVGWNAMLQNGRWVPTFPNARYLFGRRDLDFFRTQQHEATHREAFDDSVAPILDAGLAEIVEPDTRIHREIGDGIWLEDVSGHSPGNLCVIAECGAGRAIFSGDCFHHPIQLVRPDAKFFADEDPEKASATRRRLLERNADTEAIFFPAHFTGATAGRIVRDRAGSFRFRFLT